jgi:hypothetical protein
MSNNVLHLFAIRGSNGHLGGKMVMKWSFGEGE